MSLVRERANASELQEIQVLDDHPSSSVSRSFQDEGFASTHNGAVVAHTFRGHGTFSELRAIAAAMRSPLASSDLLSASSTESVHRAASAERWFAPFRVLEAGIPTFVVPIKHGWASRLLDAGLAEEQLLPREWRLGLRRELVYYRSPRNSGGLNAPARVLWYISGSEQGAGMIRAVSHLTEMAIDNHERLFHRFRQLGVYERSDVAFRADKRGRAMALRFSHTEQLKHPVPLATYRKLLTGNPSSSKVVLQSPQRIDEATFVALLQHAEGARHG